MVPPKKIKIRGYSFLWCNGYSVLWTDTFCPTTYFNKYWTVRIIANITWFINKKKQKNMYPLFVIIWYELIWVIFFSPSDFRGKNQQNKTKPTFIHFSLLLWNEQIHDFFLHQIFVEKRLVDYLLEKYSVWLMMTTFWPGCNCIWVVLPEWHHWQGKIEWA